MTPEEWAAFQQARREFEDVLDAWPMLHYAVPVTEEKIARDNARARQRLGIDPVDPPAPPAEEGHSDAG